MKKQTLFYILGGALLLLAVVAIVLVVVLFPKDSGAEPFDIKGSWYVYGGNNSTGNDEYMVFDETKVSLYREKENAYFSGDYTFEGDYINIPALSKNFYFKQDSTTSFYMIEGNSTCYMLVKVKEIFPTLNIETLQRTWKLIEKAGHVEVDQTLEFTATTITYTKNGAVQTFNYTWENSNTFKEERLGEFKVFVLDESIVELVQYINGEKYIWKLEAK